MPYTEVASTAPRLVEKSHLHFLLLPEQRDETLAKTATRDEHWLGDRRAQQKHAHVRLRASMK